MQSAAMYHPSLPYHINAYFAGNVTAWPLSRRYTIKEGCAFEPYNFNDFHEKNSSVSLEMLDFLSVSN